MAPTKPDHHKKLKELFDSVDADKSGKVDKAEMGQLIKKVIGCDPPAELVDKIVKECDKDGSGKIEFSEFEGALDAVAVLVLIIQLRMMFDEIDTDKSGKLDKKELEQMCKCAEGQGHAGEIMKKLDMDGDGKVSFEEFIQALLASESA